VSLAAGVRAATPDGLPMVGASSASGVLVAAGARRNGWLLAPLVAQLIAACVTGRDPGPYAAKLDPRRFEPR
jgi:glycine oxidase